MTNYLVIAPAWVGDMVMAQSLFLLLKKQDPKCSIDVVAPKATLSLLSVMPEVKQGFLLDVAHGELGLKKRYQLGKVLRAQQYDQAIILPASLKSALVPFFAKIPKRTGWLGEQRFGLLNDHRRLDKKQYPKEIQRFCALALPANEKLPDALPNPKLIPDKQQALAFLTKHQVDYDSAKPVIVLCPGAAYGPAKRWPVAYFARLVDEQSQLGRQVWLFGSPGEADMLAEIQQLSNQVAINFAGKTQLIDVVNLLGLADVVVANDSGLMHVACATRQSKVVAIYGSSSPGFTPPLSADASVLYLDIWCSPCFKKHCPLEGEQRYRCLLDIKPEQVVAQVNQCLNKQGE